MKYKPYKKYKDSGVEWLGEIPEDWEVTQIKYVYDIVLGKMLQPERKIPTDEFKPYLRAVNISWNGVILDSLNYMWFSKKEINSLRLVKGDLLISEGGDVGRSCIWNDELDECYFQNAINRARGKKGINKYLYYWLYNIKQSGYIDIICNKATIAHYTAEKVNETPIPLPPIHEQKAIAEFLDRETAKIDGLIERQEKLIELLQEKRQALISAVVTGKRRVTTDGHGWTRMKDSGVEWLGAIPEDWEVKRLKYLFRIQKRIAGKLGYDVLSITQRGIKIKDITKNDGQLSMDYSKYQIVEVGDFAMNHMDLLTGSVDIAKVKGVTSPDYRVFVLKNKHYPHYYKYLLLKFYIEKIFYAFGQGSAQLGRWRLGTEEFLDFILPLPPLSEQKAIAEFLDGETARIDALVEKAKISIELSKEKRQALISAAVTGKIRVTHG